MNKLFVRIALVLAGFAGLTIPAKAQSVDGLVVKIPFEFVAAGQTLPAGEYKITRLRDDKPRVLLLTSLDNRNQSVLLVPVTDATSQDKPQLGFTTVGDQRVLSRVETGVYAYTLALPRAEALLAAAPSKRPAASSASGSN
ncbi:MAG: hypothetical protein DMG38_02465 [Acidobacteria bacterium]|nr:MAG: hypothetical protein DMG38_02465 [Acidobacteriota bacterium]